MKSEKYSSAKIGIMAVFVSVGIVLQYFESRIMITSVPGGKLGLCNIISLLNIFIFGGGNAMVVSVVRALLGTLLFGGFSALPYSLSGAFLSVAGMVAVKKMFFPNVSMIGMSVVGAALHNLSQICVAVLIFRSLYVFSYLPLLLVVAVVSGISTGYCAHIFGKRILKKGEFL